ncbi:hypothetical protein E6C27_scaffold1639G00040 [Cucumis melo var. makuwa]|uniref:RNase H type-1 domain-containing protein n=1 Tax=Cucumis melo var. makuwa TaxID=1194695 RepID=A0A5A7TPR5_CUCMM|nr:hypothetical protein E6C27_scaffold1639G00040 [Cucumis melo var. makuwa]
MDELSNSKLVIQGFNQGSQRVIDEKFYLKNDNSPEAVPVEIPLVNREDNLQLKSLASKEPHKSIGTFHSRKGEASTSTTKSMILMDEKTSNPLILRYVPLSRRQKGESPFVKFPQGLKVGDMKQPKLSLIQKKLLREGHVIPVSRKGPGYKSPEPIHIIRKRKKKVIDSNHITVGEVDSMEEKEGGSQRISAFDQIRPHVVRTTVFERLSVTKTERKCHQSTSSLNKRSALQRLTMTFKKEKCTCQALRATRPSAFERLSVAKQKDAQTPRVPIFNRIRDGGSHVKTGSSIDTKKRIPNISHVKRHDVILTNPEKEDSKQGEDEISCHHITILEELEIKTPEEDTEDVPQSLEDGGQSTVDELKEEMPRLDPKVAVHHLAIKPRYQPIMQAQRRLRLELIPQIKVEVNKLIEAGFIFEVKYPTWIANIVPVRKKNEQLLVCVDFHDLNNACPKDDFPLPIIEIMVDATIGHEALSFMDGSSRYNQIRMALSDEEMTAFRTPKGIYYYKVMPFGLKNAGATYQRAMEKVFDDILHKYVECYVDDLVIKSKRRQDHLKDLKVMFDRIQKSQLRMNPLKCAFGVTSGKFLSIIAFTIHLVAKTDPIKYVLSRLIISGCLAKWVVLLQQYDIVYISQKAIKGQAFTDFLADHLIPSYWKLCEDLPDDEVFFTKVMEPWTMYFDGAARRSDTGAGIVLISPEKYMLPYSFALTKLCSNNVAEYQALIIGLQMALEIGVSVIEIYGDSKLIINHLSLQYNVKHEDLKPYFAYA